MSLHETLMKERTEKEKETTELSILSVTFNFKCTSMGKISENGSRLRLIIIKYWEFSLTRFRIFPYSRSRNIHV